MRRWLARLSFSFIILAAVFAWEGYQARAHGITAEERSRAVYFWLAAGACGALGLLGIRERHRPE